MLSVDELELYDLYQWLGNGHLVAGLGHCNQSTVSRTIKRVRGCLLGMDCHDSPESMPAGTSKLLTMERHVHQLYRFIKPARLRLHSTHWTNRSIRAKLPEPWIVNPLQCIESSFDSLDLLDSHLIDALITEGIQRPADHDVRYSIFDLYQSPVRLVTAPDSVLALETGFSPSDIGQLARITPQSYVCNQAKHCARQLFAENLSIPESRDGHAVKANLAWSIPTFSWVDPHAVEVDFGIDYSHRYVESLVVLKEHDESPAVHQLVSFLRSSFLAMAREGLTIAVL